VTTALAVRSKQSSLRPTGVVDFVKPEEEVAPEVWPYPINRAGIGRGGKGQKYMVANRNYTFHFLNGMFSQDLKAFSRSPSGMRLAGGLRRLGRSGSTIRIGHSQFHHTKGRVPDDDTVLRSRNALAGYFLADSLSRCTGLGAIAAVASRPGRTGFWDGDACRLRRIRRPTVYRVTNLNDSGPGSFRQGLEISGPRVVIFEISGSIRLRSPVYVNSPYLTIAGQTAPAPGITIQNYAIYVTTHDVLLQHLRIRHGADTCGSAFEAWGANAFNIVLDHVSASWGQDETIYLSNPTVPANVTV
jgi:hypothetical protein